MLGSYMGSSKNWSSCHRNVHPLSVLSRVVWNMRINSVSLEKAKYDRSVPPMYSFLRDLAPCYAPAMLTSQSFVCLKCDRIIRADNVSRIIVPLAEVWLFGVLLCMQATANWCDGLCKFTSKTSDNTVYARLCD